jgi:hypothetical protein
LAAALAVFLAGAAFWGAVFFGEAFFTAAGLRFAGALAAGCFFAAVLVFDPVLVLAVFFVAITGVLHRYAFNCQQFQAGIMSVPDNTAARIRPGFGKRATLPDYALQCHKSRSKNGGKTGLVLHGRSGCCWRFPAGNQGRPCMVSSSSWADTMTALPSTLALILMSCWPRQGPWMQSPVSFSNRAPCVEQIM